MNDRQANIEQLRRVVYGSPTSRAMQAEFAVFCDDLMAWAAPRLILFFLVVVIAWWPTDLFIYSGQPEAQRTIAIGRGIIVAQHLFWLTLGRRLLARRPALCGSFIAISEAWMMSALAGQMSGGLDSPWPHYTYIWPLASVALLRPLWDRCLRVLVLAGGCMACFFVSSGTPLDHPHAASTLSYMLFSAFFCTLVGHGAWLLLRKNFVQQKQIDAFNQRLEQRVLEQTRDLQVLSQRLETLREQERAWMAREMHDALGQELTGARYALDVVRKRLTGDARRLDSALADVQQRVGMAHDSVRRILQRLRPRVLDELGLPAALEWLARDAIEPGGLKATVRCAPVRLEPAYETALYRVSQEAVSNALRHAEAESIDIELTVDDAGCRLAVTDDGIGLEAGRAAATGEAGVGCIGIRERIAALGGRTRWETPAGGGTRLIVELPTEAPC